MLVGITHCCFYNNYCIVVADRAVPCLNIIKSNNAPSTTLAIC